MSKNQFAPTLRTESEVTPAVEPVVTPTVSVETDQLSNRLLLLARVLGVGLLFLLPLFFWPGLFATLGFQKVMLTLAVIVGVVTLLSLLMLRHQSVQTALPLPWLWFIGFVGVSIVSGIFSDSLLTAFRGAVVEPGTVMFLGIMAGLMGLPLVFQGSKRFTRYALQAFSVSALLALVYVVTRLFLGPVGAFGSFNSVTVSPVGSFNDLAVFAGLCILVTLVGLLQLSLRFGVQLVLFILTILALIVLAAANFFFVWVVVGFFGLVTLLYIVSRDKLLATADAITPVHNQPSYILLLTTVLVCLSSAWFIVMGDVAGAQVNRLFDVQYLEVRPSFSASIDIISSVYDEDLLLGVGPNQFIDAWRQYKDTSINETIFWATDFSAASSFVTTTAATTGLLGLATLLLFHAWFLWFGFRMLLRGQIHDRFWYFVGAVSFTAASFLWLMTYLYVPGTTIMLLAAFMTGVTFVSSAALLPNTVRTVSLVSSRPRGFALMALAILLISGSVGVLFTVSEQYLARSTFTVIQASTTDIAVLDQAALSSYAQFPSDDFLGVRARIALLEMNQLLALAEPSEAQQQQFLDVSGRALIAANQAIAVAPEEPEYHAILAGIYNNLALAGIPDALERSNQALAAAKNLDPKNPTYTLIEAQMAVRRGDVETARTALGTALSQKRNFTEALFLLAQLDIAAGDTAAAIETTRAIITLEPNNPTRYYQLGILETAAGDIEAAIAAYNTALVLDPEFANARYLRALLLANSGSVELAVSELQLVQETNQDNETLASLIDVLTSGTSTVPVDGQVLVPELAPQVTDDTVTSPVAPDSDLLTPLNTVPEATETESISTEAIEPVEEPADDTTATSTAG